LYEDKFGFIFIVCATGKSADEMLAMIKIRLNNNANAEMRNAAKEQNKITQLRLEKLLLL
jgi:2-oxo-4-hydroxy-4-carboxy-5-ureidoimidazoline decarboxylase